MIITIGLYALKGHIAKLRHSDILLTTTLSEIGYETLVWHHCELVASLVFCTMEPGATHRQQRYVIDEYEYTLSDEIYACICDLQSCVAYTGRTLFLPRL